MDLLVKWLGRESSKFSQNIRASNVNNPNAGLRRIWERLDERYGRPEMVEAAIKTKLQKFPKLTNKDHSRLYELLDILTQIESSKENEPFSNLLSYFDSSSGVLPIVDKLPYNIQEKWTTRASQYKLRNNVPFPPFSYLVQFIREVSAVKNDPAFIYSNTETSFSRKNETRKVNHGATSVFNRKTDVNIKQKEEKETVRCPINKANHHLNTCRAFKAMTYEERRKYLKDNNICFKCCHSTTRMSRNCTVTVKCDHCGSNYHITAMHVTAKSTCPDGGEKSSDTTQNANDQTVSSKCTLLCGFSGKSCGKTVQVRVYPKNFPDKAVNVYAILDDQSNRTLAKTELFDQLGINTSAIQYTMSSCAGRTIMNGRCAESLIVESLSGSGELEIHSVIECSAIPDEKSEIPTPDIAKSYPHLREIAHQILDLNPNIDIQLLIGRDVPEAHHVFRQLTGPKGTPFAQELFFGWVIIGDVCLGKVHKPNFVHVNKTNVMNNGRGTIFEPCINTLYVKENTELAHIRDNVHSQRCNNDPLFIKTKDDDKIGTSVQDRLFLNLMDSEFKKDSNGHWTAPLPFRPNRQRLPNNRSQAWKRAQILDKSFQQNFTKKTHFVEFMQKVLVSGAAEVAPIITDEECWYLPLFGVYHQNKPNQIRGVFDSSASFEGVSLNSVMMSGPDLTNNLLGILLRFRSDQFAATADIEQMFYQFYVREEDRNFLRFFWYKDNNPDNPLIEHLMCVNVFGNSASPAVATYGLRKTVENSNETFGSDVKTFVNRDFYVDDGLISLPESEQVIDLITRTQMALKTEGNIRLHKITSNSSDVMKAFPADDIGKDLKNLNLCEDYFPVQHSLGLAWDLNTDSFIFTPLQDDKPCTRRGILSSLNSIFDPIGFLSPLTISGKILLRDASPPGTDWDECLSQSFQEKWNEWRISVLSLRELSIPRMYIPMSISVMDNLEVHVFSDASEKAVAA
ncbi:uncharacterized protein [Mytilus edulis]|uniref:uncharacterized protein n=1 Tax=Mytilus edulis TaxID=6550 RepID=UPI0039F01366